MEKSDRNFGKLIIAILLPAIIICGTFICSGFLKTAYAQSGSINELRKKIEEKNREIELLTIEIKKSETELRRVSGEANTLQSAVKSLDLEQSRLSNDIKLAEKNIQSSELNLDRLAIEIKQNEGKIDKNLEGLSESIRLINDNGDKSIIEILLKYENVAEFWEEVETLESFQSSVRQNLSGLKDIKKILEEKHKETEIRKKDLENFKSDLDAKHQVAAINKKQKEVLLTETKNREAEYKIILERNLARKAEFEKELFEFESQLQIAIDPSKIPPARAGVLSWPLDNIYVTQFFGRTVDSKRLYSSGTHNGVDFRATMGTRVKASATGVVSHIGNTDEIPGCYSFGKWILIRHNNGLSTLYSHLSVINVSPNQTVSTGDIIAYSGGAPGTPGAGYSTGPHLHFGLYATEGLRPQRYQSKTPCNGAYMPLADQKAYLDPMAYLPAL